MNGWARAVLWAVGLPLVAVPAYWAGSSWVQCSGRGCDPALFSGVSWAVTAAFVHLVVACAVELTLAVVESRRARQPVS